MSASSSHSSGVTVTLKAICVYCDGDKSLGVGAGVGGGRSNLDMEEQEGFPEKVILGLKPADIGVNW